MNNQIKQLSFKNQNNSICSTYHTRIWEQLECWQRLLSAVWLHLLWTRNDIYNRCYKYFNDDSNSIIITLNYPAKYQTGNFFESWQKPSIGTTWQSRLDTKRPLLETDFKLNEIEKLTDYTEWTWTINTDNASLEPLFWSTVLADLQKFESCVLESVWIWNAHVCIGILIG